MKYLYIGIVVLHGLIHVMGFTKAFGLASVPQLRTAIALPLGVLWLVAALLFLASAALFFVLPNRWWLAALAAVAVSQVLIITAWSDAKVGTVANLIVLVPALLAALSYAPWGFPAQFQRDRTSGFQNAATIKTTVTAADLAPLPPAVQRYLRFAGVVGQPRVSNYHVMFTGALRNGPSDAWMSMTAEQQSFVAPAERLFLVDAHMFGVPATAYHRYIGDAAVFNVSVAGLVEMVDARGPEMNRSETVTLFNDMCLLAPATLIDPHIRWEELGPLTVRATFTNAGQTISAILNFDDTGALTNFVSDDRFRTLDGKRYERVRWSTPISAWQTVAGHRVPVADARWQLPAGEFAYGRLTVTDIAYNVTAH